MKRAFAEFLVASGHVAPEVMASLVDIDWENREPIGRLALLHGLLCGRDIDYILGEQSAKGGLFGEIAIRLGLLTERQLNILLTGQGLRGCAELVEDLAIAGAVESTSGIKAISTFITGAKFRERISVNSPSVV